MSDTRLRFQIEGVQTIRSEMSTILRDVVTQTQLIENSNKEFVKSLQKQIELLKERNRVSSQFTSGALPNQGGGESSLILRDINTNLSELIELLKKQFSDESTPEDQRPNQGPRQKQKEEGGIDLKTLQTFALANLINPLQSRDPFSAGFGVAGNVGSAMMMQGGKMGWAGLALAATVGLAKMQVDILKDIEPVAARMARLTGRSPMDFLNTGRNSFADLGFTRADVLGQRGSLLKALGTDSPQNLSSLLAIQKGFDVSGEELLGLSKVGRGEKDFNLNRVFTSLYTGLQYGGLGKEKSEAFIPEYLRVLTEIGQEQLSTLGKVDFGINTKLITALSAGGERLQNPETLKLVTKGIIQGLTQASTPQIEAIQFQALSRISPGRSLWGLEKMREAPLEKGNEQYLPEFLRNLNLMSPDREGFERIISQVFGIGKNVSGDVASAFLKGDFDLLKKELKPAISEQDVYNRAIQAVDRFEKSIAVLENVKVGKFTEDVSSGLNKVNESLAIMVGLKDGKEVIPGDITGMQSKFAILAAPYLLKILGK